MEVDSQRNQQEPFLVHVKAAFDMVAARKRPAIVTAGCKEGIMFCIYGFVSPRFYTT